MPDIHEALLESRRMGRDPYGLRTIYQRESTLGSPLQRFTAVVDGHEGVYDTTIEWDSRFKLNLSRSHNARWHCTCEDFRFTFFPYIQEQGHALGEFPLYIPNGRGLPRAISGYGLCKHVAALLDCLVHDNHVKRK